MQLARFCSCMHSRPCLAQGSLRCHAVCQRALQAITPPQDMLTHYMHNKAMSQVTLCNEASPATLDLQSQTYRKDLFCAEQLLMNVLL